jgi:hypothetical protein
MQCSDAPAAAAPACAAQRSAGQPLGSRLQNSRSRDAQHGGPCYLAGRMPSQNPKGNWKAARPRSR